jgi:hypothetical protein
MDPTGLPRKFLTAWVSHPRRSSGQHYTLQNSYVETLQHILPNIPDNGTIDSWLPLAQNHEQLNQLRNLRPSLLQHQLRNQQLSQHPNPHLSLLRNRRLDQHLNQLRNLCPSLLQHQLQNLHLGILQDQLRNLRPSLLQNRCLN